MLLLSLSLSASDTTTTGVTPSATAATVTSSVTAAPTTSSSSSLPAATTAIPIVTPSASAASSAAAAAAASAVSSLTQSTLPTTTTTASATADPLATQWEELINGANELMQTQDTISTESWYVLGAYFLNACKTGLTCWAAPVFETLPNPNVFMGFYITLSALEAVCDYKSKHNPIDQTASQNQLLTLLQNLPVLEQSIMSYIQECQQIAINEGSVALKEHITQLTKTHPLMQDYEKVVELKSALSALITFIKSYDDFLTEGLIEGNTSSQLFINLQNAFLLWSIVGTATNGGMGTNAISKTDPMTLAQAQTIILISNTLRQGADLSKKGITASDQVKAIFKERRLALGLALKRCPNFAHDTKLTKHLQDNAQKIQTQITLDEETSTMVLIFHLVMAPLVWLWCQIKTWCSYCATSAQTTNNAPDADDDANASDSSFCMSLLQTLLEMHPSNPDRNEATALASLDQLHQKLATNKPKSILLKKQD